MLLSLSSHHLLTAHEGGAAWVRVYGGHEAAYAYKECPARPVWGKPCLRSVLCPASLTPLGSAWHRHWPEGQLACCRYCLEHSVYLNTCTQQRRPRGLCWALGACQGQGSAVQSRGEKGEGAQGRRWGLWETQAPPQTPLPGRAPFGPADRGHGAIRALCPEPATRLLKADGGGDLPCPEGVTDSGHWGSCRPPPFVMGFRDS